MFFISTFSILYDGLSSPFSVFPRILCEKLGLSPLNPYDRTRTWTDKRTVTRRNDEHSHLCTFDRTWRRCFGRRELAVYSRDEDWVLVSGSYPSISTRPRPQRSIPLRFVRYKTRVFRHTTTHTLPCPDGMGTAGCQAKPHGSLKDLLLGKIFKKISKYTYTYTMISVRVCAEYLQCMARHFVGYIVITDSALYEFIVWSLFTGIFHSWFSVFIVVHFHHT